jgi:hypothetical protein
LDIRYNQEKFKYMSYFICKCCEKKYDFDNYSMKIENDKTIYFNKHDKKELLCEKGEVLKPEDNSFKGVPMLNSFGSLSKQDKQKSLLKRSQQNFKKEISEKKYEMNKKAVQDFKNFE